jgi:ABC-type maltose transport system permease subunit
MSIVVTVPIVVVFFALQRYIVGGLTLEVSKAKIRYRLVRPMK